VHSLKDAVDLRECAAVHLRVEQLGDRTPLAFALCDSRHLGSEPQTGVAALDGAAIGRDHSHPAQGFFKHIPRQHADGERHPHHQAGCRFGSVGRWGEQAGDELVAGRRPREQAVPLGCFTPSREQAPKKAELVAFTLRQVRQRGGKHHQRRAPRQCLTDDRMKSVRCPKPTGKRQVKELIRHVPPVRPI
jgi:hypothetical protein